LRRRVAPCVCKFFVKAHKGHLQAAARTYGNDDDGDDGSVLPWFPFALRAFGSVAARRENNHSLSPMNDFLNADGGGMFWDIEAPKTSPVDDILDKDVAGAPSKKRRVRAN